MGNEERLDKGFDENERIHNLSVDFVDLEWSELATQKSLSGIISPLIYFGVDNHSTGVAALDETFKQMAQFLVEGVGVRPRPYDEETYDQFIQIAVAHQEHNPESNIGEMLQQKLDRWWNEIEMRKV